MKVLFFLFAFGVAGAILTGSLVLMEYGRRIGEERRAKSDGTGNGLGAVEGAVFALMGLLLAFAISGGLQRFDERRQLIFAEANAINAAYSRLDLLQVDARDRLRADVKSYLENRLELFRMPVNYSVLDHKEIFSSAQQGKIQEIARKIWDEAVPACRNTSDTTACVLLLPALNLMFEQAELRRGAVDKHPPAIIYAMLFGLGLGGSLLAGYGMGVAGSRSWLHMLIFAGALAITLYAITDIEFPRLGLIRVDVDHFLYEALARMH